MARTSFKKEVEKAVDVVNKHPEKEIQSVANSARFPLLLPSGCSLLNLACTDSIRGIMPPGSFMNLVGDSNAGKSILAMTIMASTFYKHGDLFDYYDDDVEQARHWNAEMLFGKRFVQALKKPELSYGESPVVEIWFQNLQRMIKHAKKTNRPFLCVTDSWDCMKTFQDEKTFEAISAGKKAGSYGASKAKMASDLLGKIVNQLASIKSNLIIVSQTHDSMNAMTFAAAKTRAGGKALSYYANIEVWLAVKEKLYVGSDQDKEQVGSQVIAKVKRTRFTGKARTIEFPIYYSYGIDDVESICDWSEKHNLMKRKGKRFIYPSIVEEPLSRRKMVVHIDKSGLTKQLRNVVSKYWHSREQNLVDMVLQGRPPKFT